VEDVAARRLNREGRPCFWRTLSDANNVFVVKQALVSSYQHIFELTPDGQFIHLKPRGRTACTLTATELSAARKPRRLDTGGPRYLFALRSRELSLERVCGGG